jgi:hypothetical protein
MAARERIGEVPVPEKAPALRGWAKVFGVPKDPGSYGKYRKKPSPDGAFALVFDPGFEFAMMGYAHQFRLVDPQKNVLEAFSGLTSPAQIAAWSPDSRIVAIPISDPAEGILLLNVRRRLHSFILCDIYLQEMKLESRGVRIGMDAWQFEAIFEGAVPLPEDVVIRFADLRWFPSPRAEAWDLKQVLKSAPSAHWKPPRTKAFREFAKKRGIEFPRGRG